MKTILYRIAIIIFVGGFCFFFARTCADENRREAPLIQAARIRGFDCVDKGFGVAECRARCGIIDHAFNSFPCQDGMRDAFLRTSP